MAKRSSKGLGGMSVAQLQAEIRRRERGATKLMKKRDGLLARVAELDDQIRAAGAKPGKGGRGGAGRRRARNDANLADALKKLLTGKTMSVTDAAAKVQEAGYRTTSPNFRTIVNQCLIASGNFKRMGRGQYTAK